MGLGLFTGIDRVGFRFFKVYVSDDMAKLANFWVCSIRVRVRVKS